MKNHLYQPLFRPVTVIRVAFFAGILSLAAPVLPPSALYARATAAPPQSGPRQSFQAIQSQTQTISAALTRSTVAIYAGDGTGSGVIVTPDGLVLTAGHVIEGQQGQRLRVILEDGRNLPATFLGADSRSDLGLIQIENVKNLPTAPIGDSATLRKGQWVLATGHPLGRRQGRPPVLRVGRVFASTATSGAPRDRQRIATDATLLNGDSGGPLFDLNGRVVGIHSMITSSGRFSASIHIPVNLSKAAMERVRQGGAPVTWAGPTAAFTTAFRSAQESFAEGDTKAALLSARRAAEADSSSALAQLLLARTLARSGQRGPAVSALQAALKGGYNDTTALREDADLKPLLREPILARLLERTDTLNGVPGERKGDRYFRTATQEVVSGLERGTVRIRSAGKVVALGTILSAEGDILTKASELPEGPLECILPDGEVVSAERLSDDADWDITLLKVEAPGLEPVSLGGATQVGHWTFSPNGTEEPAAVGVVGVMEMPVRGRGIAPRATSKAYMGVQMEPVQPDTLRALGLSQGVRVLVEKDRPAARAGIQNGDILIEADGRPVESPDGLMDLMVGKEPGDTLRVRFARGGSVLDATIDLTSRPRGIPGRGGMLEMLSGEVSRLSGPFPRVLHHDTVLRPNAMGGPLLDMEGRCLGINIARADRTSTYAIRAEDVKRIYARLRGASS